MTEAQVEELFLAGPGACPPKPTQFSWTAPIQASYGSPTYRIELALRDDAGQPVVNRSVHLESIVGAWPYSTSTADRITDANGYVYWDAPLKNATPGTYTDFLSATFNGDSEYVRAYVEPDVVVGKGNPTITWPTPAPIAYGTPLGSTQLNATTPVAGTFTYSPSSGSVQPAGEHTLTANFTPSNTAYYNNATASVALTVNKATPTITLAGGTFGYDGQPHAASGSVRGVGGANLGSPTLTYNGSADAPINAGAYDVVATFAGNSNYNSATATATITIAKAATVVTWSAPAAIVYGTSLGEVQLNATAGVPGTFAYTPGSGTVLDAGSAQTLSVTFTPTDATNYDPATKTTTIDVAKATPMITVNGGSFTYDGQPHAASAAVTGVGGVALTPLALTYNGSPDAPVQAGSYEVKGTFPGNSNYTAASATATLTIAKASTTVNWSTPAAIVHGTPLSSAQLNATASVPGTFTYSPTAGTILNAGAGQTLSVTFSPTDSTNYNGASTSTTIDVSKASAVLGWNAPGAIVYGTPLGGAQLTATANVAGSFTFIPAAGTVLSAGTHSLSATFVPADAVNYNGGTVSTSIAVAPASLTVVANDASKQFGAPLPGLTAAFSGFMNGDTAASLSGTLVVATSATQNSAVGAYPIVPSGVASPNYSVAFVNGTLTVVRGAVAVALVTSPEPSGLGQPMTFTATVSAAAPAAGSPTGVVQFLDGPTLLGTAALAGGSASLSTAGLAAGSHAIEARYEGDASFQMGSAASSHVVNDAASTPTLSLSSSRNPSATGQLVTLTANISMSAGAVTGNVEFWDGATLLGTSAISAGRATFVTSALANGSHAITARYLGSTSAPPSISGVLVQAVGGSGWKNRTTTASVTSSANPAALGETVTLTATIVGSSSSTPTGRVLFMIDGSIVGDPAGVAVTFVSGTTVRAALPVSGLAYGAHKVTVTYLGDPNYKGSTAALTQTIN